MKEFLEYHLHPIEKEIKILENQIKKDCGELETMQPIFIKQLAERVCRLAELKSKRDDLLNYIDYAKRK